MVCPCGPFSYERFSSVLFWSALNRVVDQEEKSLSCLDRGVRCCTRVQPR